MTVHKIGRVLIALFPCANSSAYITEIVLSLASAHVKKGEVVTIALYLSVLKTVTNSIFK